MALEPVTETAHAKVNLCLHVTGKRGDNYHLLESIIAFTDLGDHIMIEEGQGFALDIKGPFANALQGTPTKENLICKAAQMLADLLNMPLDVKITLVKNLPVASGLGGGSADAAAILRGLIKFWKLGASPDMSSTLVALGADVPVCFHQKNCYVTNIGDIIEKPITLPKIPVVLINPNLPCLTINIFKGLHPPYSDPMTHKPASFESVSSIVSHLKTTRNDLYGAATAYDPDIIGMMEELNAQPLCKYAQMTGSGATCFGLFETIEDAEKTCQAILATYPTWWVKPTYIM